MVPSKLQATYGYLLRVRCVTFGFLPEDVTLGFLAEEVKSYHVTLENGQNDQIRWIFG